MTVRSGPRPSAATRSRPAAGFLLPAKHQVSREDEASLMFTRILVPTDFGAPSEAALAYARRLANEFDAQLHLLHIGENLFLRAVVADPRSLEAVAVRRLQD